MDATQDQWTVRIHTLSDGAHLARALHVEQAHAVKRDMH